MKIAINGAGIAGTALAWHLRKSGHDVLLIEQAPRFRTGGYAIDFWGIGYDIAEKMGLLPRIKEMGFQMVEMRYVDRMGKKTGGFPVDVFRRMTKGRFTEIQRGDLAAIIYESLGNEVETLFGDSIAQIHDDGERVQIEFDHAGPREVDLVIGADGLHSRVRALSFGPEAQYEVPLGYHVAAFDADSYQPREDLVAVSLGAPGRQITRLSMPGGRTLFLFVFRDEILGQKFPSSQDECKAALRKIFADDGWEAAEILCAMDKSPELYFDSVSQIRMDRWTQGRVALVGDAAACVSLLAGEGSGLAMAEAYVLAGELRESGGDFRAAFARYQERLMPFLRAKQDFARKFASSFAPKTAFGVAYRDKVSILLRIPWIANLLIGRSVRDDIALPEYDLLRTERRGRTAP